MATPAERPLRIAFVSQPEYFRFMYDHGLDDLGEVFEFVFTKSLSDEDYEPLVAFKPDMTFFFRGEHAPLSVLDRLGGLRIALSSEPFPRIVAGRSAYTRDSLARYLSFRSIRAKPFDYVFHYDAASIPFMAKDGLNASGEFAFPVATGMYRPAPAAKEWDVFFVGRSTYRRELHFSELKHRFGFLHIAHGVYGPALVDFIARSRIGLNVHAENDISWEPRLQMMLACGMFVISDRITPNGYLRPGTDYVEVDGPDELLRTVQHYLRDESAREVIARNGLDRVRERLDARAQFAALIEGLGGRYPRFEVGSSSLAMNTVAALRTGWRRVRGLSP